MIDNRKKKIRGWKRQIRKIDSWVARVFDLDRKHLTDYNRDYAKLWIHPFYALPRRNPPTWYNRLLLKAMLDVHANWNKQLSMLNTPFYLKIWLYDPHFIHSQIVVAYKDDIDYYSKTFDISTMVQPFPYHKYITLSGELKKFDWTLHIESEVYTESDLTEYHSNGWMSKKKYKALKSKAYKSLPIDLADGSSEQAYSLRIGDVWIGSLISNGM
ncbi:hypothetical protein [Paenibacillus sinopodophylli]|uniref:hypothetical protein n=1 Tax=Paenibacillus sinopodophylli TaxID=1837342 RepID=UPI00110C8EDC|nr:hypothetical protein [Paenibacillus sinopodophylli]